MSNFLFFKTFSKIMFKDMWRDFDTTLKILCIVRISIYHQGYMCHQGSTGPTLCICFQKKVHFSKDKLIFNGVYTTLNNSVQNMQTKYEKLKTLWHPYYPHLITQQTFKILGSWDLGSLFLAPSPPPH